LKEGKREKGRWRGANKKYFIFYLRKRKSFLPLQSQTKRAYQAELDRKAKKIGTVNYQTDAEH